MECCHSMKGRRMNGDQKESESFLLLGDLKNLVGKGKRLLLVP